MMVVSVIIRNNREYDDFIPFISWTNQIMHSTIVRHMQLTLHLHTPNQKFQQA